MPMSLSTSGRDDASGHESVTDEDALDGFVHAFEVSYVRNNGADPADFLPASDHPLYPAVLRELVRVDMEFGWERGRPRDLADYLRAFPALNADPVVLRQIAFEEYRLRRQAGQDPNPDEYSQRYGVMLDSEVGRFRSLAPSRVGTGAGGSIGRPTVSRVPAPTRVRGLTGPTAIPGLPEVGDHFLGFRLIGELGSGSFGRVYLARQGEMADRPVVLKITADGHDESQTLAQLQHDHIVPIYSRHREGRLRAVCMPYLGAVTLRDVVDDLKRQGPLPDSGLGLLSSLGKSSVRKSARTRTDSAQPAPLPSPVMPSPIPSRSPISLLPGTRRNDETTPASDPADVRSVLGALTYVEAVAWIGAKLADGLAHAHERGILHRDMKPANILLTDDGRPMLLDFNLAEDLKLREPGAGGSSAVGGTLPYMSPEHLMAYLEGRGTVDARSDIFSFGVILFEMLTGRPPYPIRDGLRPETVRAMIVDRQAASPRLRPWNPAVSPALESVVRRCLEADPKLRYASARQISEDLQSHLAHRPLRHAPDPSPVERVGKWFRRNRRVAVGSTVLLALAGLIVGFSAVMSKRSDALGRHEARAAFDRFRESSTTALNLLDTWSEDVDPARLREGLDSASKAFDEFQIRTDSLYVPWWTVPPASLLDAPRRERLRTEAGELLLLTAGLSAHQARMANPAASKALLQAAEADNRRAERCYESGQAPRSVWSQRADLLERLGDAHGAQLAAAKAKTIRLVSARDYFLKARDVSRAGKQAEALPLFESAIGLAPDQYRLWLAAGNCQNQLGRAVPAMESFSTCIALWAGHPSAWANRGDVELRLGRYQQAANDLDRALALKPDDSTFLVNRALADVGLKRYVEAVRYYDRAIALGYPQTRIYFMRSIARAGAGDAEGARRDRAEALRREPTDELSWIERSKARSDDHDHLGALSDIEHALLINPVSHKALNNKMSLLSEELGRTAEAIDVADKALTLYPEWTETRAYRGIFLARLGRRDAALADADKILDQNANAFFRQLAADIFALTSRQNPEDRHESLRLLASALRLSPQLYESAAADTDLDPIRNDPKFQRLLADAKARALAAAQSVDVDGRPGTSSSHSPVPPAR